MTLSRTEKGSFSLQKNVSLLEAFVSYCSQTFMIQNCVTLDLSNDDKSLRLGANGTSGFWVLIFRQVTHVCPEGFIICEVQVHADCARFMEHRRHERMGTGMYCSLPEKLSIHCAIMDLHILRHFYYVLVPFHQSEDLELCIHITLTSL